LKQGDQEEIAAMSCAVKGWSTEETTIDIEDDSSAQPLLEPKIEGASGSKKRKADVGSPTRTPSSTPSSIAQHLLSRQFTPSATLPFSPETTIAFKPLDDVKSPQSSEHVIAKQKSGRVVANGKKLHYY
jgi:hypothetical protein